MKRYRRPDKKNALSILNAAAREMKFTRSMKIDENSGPTIVRNVYEAFRMLGDALMAARGTESHDHVEPIKELLKLRVNTKRPIYLIDNLRKLRHNINYYGYQPRLAEVSDAIDIANKCFEPLLKAVTEETKN